MRETEAKFAVVDKRQPAELVAALDLPHGLALIDEQHIQTVDVYLDTPDMRLARHGYALRIRRKNGLQFITLKSFAGGRDSGIQDRLEIESSLGAGSQVFGPRGWPREIRKILASVAGQEAQWQPRCMIVQAREKHIVVLPSAGDDATPEHVRLAELSVDEVDVVAPTAEGEHGSPGLPAAAHFAEIEVELLDDAYANEYGDLATWLSNQEGLAALGGNKLVRGLRAVAGQPLDGSTTASGIQPKMHMADACRLIWRQQLTEIVLNEAGVRADEDIEFVHDMRVATRRARAAHVLLGGFFRRKQVRPHLAFFKRTAKRLGRVRDLDVALKKLAKYRRTLPKEQRPDLKPLAKYWKKQRKTLLAQLIQWLNSDAYTLSLIELEGFCTEPGAGARRLRVDAGEPAPAIQVRHVLPSRILDRFEAVRRYEVLFEEEGSPPLTSLHALRIDCKYLRYVLEFSEHLLGEDGEALIAQLKRLQDVLGDLNDADVARAMLQGLPESLYGDGVDAYIRRQETVIETLSGQVPLAFAAFVGPENRLFLARAIAKI